MGSPLSISPARRATRTRKVTAPRLHDGDRIAINGLEVTVDTVEQWPAPPLATHMWIIQSHTPTGATVTSPREAWDEVELIAEACPHWSCRRAGCRAHATAPNWTQASLDRARHDAIWHGVAA